MIVRLKHFFNFTGGAGLILTTILVSPLSSSAFVVAGFAWPKKVGCLFLTVKRFADDGCRALLLLLKPNVPNISGSSGSVSKVSSPSSSSSSDETSDIERDSAAV
jgi:hypothetical protein